MKRHFAHDRKHFHFNHIQCPHCGSAMVAEVTGCAERNGLWEADCVDIACSNGRCEQWHPGPMDTQSTWQPIIDRITADINSKWHFGRVENVA